MPNDIANNMVDTIHLLEEDNASLLESLTNLQLAYNEQMVELKKAKRLLKLALEDIKRTDACFLCKYNDNYDTKCGVNEGCFVWRHADEVEELLDLTKG